MPRIQLLGEVGLHLDDGPVQLRSTKELGLLAILAEAHPRPITRGYVLDLLWPSSDPDRARRSLNQAVYAIRQAVGQDALRGQLDLLALDGPDWTCDLWDLDDLVARAASTRTPLPRFARSGRLPDTIGFRDWLDRTNARVDAHLVSSYCAALDKLMERGRFEAVEPIARAVLEIDPYAETGLYHLALSIANSGRITAAIQEIVEARERFERDLDRALPAAFDALQDRLESAEAFEAARRPLSGGADPMVFPFVGREEEFTRLRSAWDHIGETGRRIILVSGEPGIGKTRLVDRLARLASIGGGRVLHTECFAAHKRVAFAAISEALRGLRTEELAGLDAIWRRVLFSSFALEAAGTALEPPPRLDPEAEQLRLFEAATLAIQASASKRRVLVIVDDLQWLDQSSAAVLQHVIRRCEEDPVLFVFAARERELRVDDELREFVANNRGGHFLDIELAALDAAACLDLAKEAILAAGDIGSEAEAEGTLEALGGNPFLITEAVRSGQGLVDRSCKPDQARFSPTPMLATFLSERLRPVSAEAVTVACILSVWGREVDPTDIAQFLNWQVTFATTVLAELEGVGLVEHGTKGVRFRHSIYREWFYQSESNARRRYLHGQIASYLGSTEPADHGTAAQHYEAAGDRKRARTHALLAARLLREAGAHSEAEYFLEAAARLSLSEEEQSEAEVLLADHLYTHSSPDRALELYQRLLYGNGTMRGNPAAYYMARCRELQVQARRASGPTEGLLAEFLHLLREARSCGCTCAAIGALTSAGRIAWHVWDPELAIRLREEASSLADAAATEPEFELQARRVALQLSIQMDDLAAAQVAARRLAQADLSGLSVGAQAEITQSLGIHMWWTGDLRGAESRWTEALQASRAWGAINHIGSALVDLAVVLHYRDQSTAAVSLLEEAKLHACKHRLISEETFADVNLIIISFELSQFSEVERRLATLGPAHVDNTFPEERVINAIRGLFFLERDNEAEARLCLEAAQAGRGREQDPSFLVTLEGRLAKTSKELDAALNTAEAARRGHVPGRVCRWKTELAWAEIAGRAGRTDQVGPVLAGVRQAAIAGGATRIARQAVRLEESLRP